MHLTLPPTASHQLQHPWASSAGGKASKQAKNDDDGPGSDEDVRRVGGVVGYQRDVRAQHHLPPYSHCQQDGSCYLEGGSWRDGCNKNESREQAFISALLRDYNSCVLAAVARGRRRKWIKVEQKSRAITVRRRRRQTGDTNVSAVWDSNHLLSPL